MVLALAYFAALAGILFWPSPVDRPIDGALMHLIQWLHARGLPQWLVSYRKVEFAANILLFVPFGTIVTLLVHRRFWWLPVVIAAALSGAVELAQGIFLPERVPAWSDIAANTSGAFIGAQMVLVLWFLSRRRALAMARRAP